MKLDHAKISSKFIVVVGDVMLDAHVWGSVERISPEAPVPVVSVIKETFVPGGASNVAHNIKKLGAKAGICAVTGTDAHGMTLRSMLHNLTIDTNGMLEDDTRPTTVKTRVIAHNQHVVRIDKESCSPTSAHVEYALLQYLHAIKDVVDGIIIEDYGKGVVTPSLIKKVLSLYKDKNIPITVDPKEAHYKMYKGVTLLTPNHHEAGAMYGKKIKTMADLFTVGDGIMHDLECEALLITRGKDGMTLFKKNKDVFHIPTVAREAYDVTGAGDTVIATLTTLLASGYDYEHAAFISNVAAGIVVEQPGVVPIEPLVLEERLKHERFAVQKIR